MAVREPSEEFDFALIDQHESEDGLPGQPPNDYDDDGEVAPGRLVSSMFTLTPSEKQALMRHPQVRALIRSLGIEILQVVRRVPSDRARWQADCMLVALGGEVRLDGSSATQTAIGREHGRTKAAVSKTAKLLAREFGFPPGQFNKSPDACRTYSLRNRSPFAPAH